MSEEEADNKSKDVVKREDYNKVIEAQNSLKADKEKVEKELKELKEAQEKELKEKEDAQKKSWEKEKEEKDKLIAELKEKAEAGEKVSKGLVKEPKKTEDTPEKVKEMLNEKIPDGKYDPNKVGSNISRYGHYKNPTTKEFTDDQLGMALDLNRGAASMNPEHIPNEAKSSKNDLIL